MDSGYSATVAALAATTTACIYMKLFREKERKKRQCLRKWRQQRLKIMRNCELFDSTFRMTNDSFLKILQYVSEDLKPSRLLGVTLSAEDKLAFTLWYLVNGELFRTLYYKPRVADLSMSKIIQEVCAAIYKNMRQKYLKFPESKDEWIKVSEDFYNKRLFPLCLGALKGYRIALKTPKNLMGEDKDFNSIALLAMVDAKSKFTFIDVGYDGRLFYNEVLKHSDLMFVLKNASHYFPQDGIVGNGRYLPYVIIADESFPLCDHLLRPYPENEDENYKTVFNARLHHARQSVEIAILQLIQRFRVLQTKINLVPQTVKTITQACCVLHNYLIERSDLGSLSDPRDCLKNEKPTQEAINDAASDFTDASSEIRRRFANYFSLEGKIKTYVQGKLQTY